MNVLLTNRCNRRCSYCFLGSDLVAPDADGHDMRREDFSLVLRYAEQLVTLGAKERLNIMGGEPTLHPEFEGIFKKALAYRGVRGGLEFLPVNVFSNGLFERGIGTLMAREACGLMININHPDTYNSREWELLESNLGEISSIARDSGKLSFSFNIYSPEQEFDFLLDMAARHGVSQVRVDLSRPAPGRGNTFVDTDQLKGAVGAFVALVRSSRERNIDVISDCCLPVCSFSDEQLKDVIECGVDISFSCSGAIDVNYDLELWYCGPLRHLKFGKVTDFADGREILKALEAKTYHLRWNVFPFDRCESCKWRTLKICQCGCLSLKSYETAGATRAP